MAAGGASQAEAQSISPAGNTPEAAPKPGPAHGAVAHRAVQYPRVFAGRHLTVIAFPLGGVAAGASRWAVAGSCATGRSSIAPTRDKSVSYAFPEHLGADREAQAGRARAGSAAHASV